LVVPASKDRQNRGKMWGCKYFYTDDGGTYCEATSGCPIPKDGAFCNICGSYEGKQTKANRLVEPKIVLTNPNEVKNALERIGAFAGVCTGKDAENHKRGKDCVEAGHGSSQRSFNYNFSIEGISISAAREHIRHSVGVAHNEQSTRYVDLRDFKYVRPDGLKDLNVLVALPNAKNVALSFDDIMGIINQFYIGCVDGKNSQSLKVKKDIARYVLPLATETKVNSSFTFQALTHYANQRLCSRAHDEIRELAELIKKEIEAVDPDVAQYMVEQCHENSIGYCNHERSCGKRLRKGELLTSVS